MARIIEVVVSPTGETTVQTKGYAGTDCLQASRFLEQSLGVVTTEDRKTAELPTSRNPPSSKSSSKPLMTTRRPGGVRNRSHPPDFANCFH